MRTVCKVRELTLSLRVGTLWRCGDFFFSKYLTRQAMHFLQRSTHFSKTCCRPLHHFEISGLGAHFSWLEKPKKSHGARYELHFLFGLEKVDRWNPIRTSAIQSRSRRTQFLGFSNHEKGDPRQEILKWSTVCSTFWRTGRRVVRSTSLAKGGTSKKRPSPHLHKVPTRINKASPRTFQTAFVHVRWTTCYFFVIFYSRPPDTANSLRLWTWFANTYFVRENNM
jgi:hypothetical protein